MVNTGSEKLGIWSCYFTPKSLKLKLSIGVDCFYFPVLPTDDSSPSTGTYSIPVFSNHHIAVRADQVGQDFLV